MDGAKHTWLRTNVMRRRGSVQDWEEWEDVQVFTPVHAADTLTTAPPPKTSASRHSSTRVKRLRSRRRQKAQNAKAGIKLITDMTAFKRNNNNNNLPPVPPADARPPKFVDAAALRALEGEPSSASIGSWNWLRRDGNRTPVRATPDLPEPELSPEDRPIVIGISIPSDRVSSRHVSQQASIVDIQETTPPAGLKSVWSPDTPDTTSSFNYRPSGSSMASVMTGSASGDAPPPVPALPAGYNNLSGIVSPASAASNHSEDDDSTPCTLFEEDGSSAPQRPARLALSTPTPDSATSRAHGWWDHVVTPFLDKRLSLLSYPGRKVKVESPRDGARSGHGFTENAGGPLLPVHAPIVREPSPRRVQSPHVSLPFTSSSRAPSPCQGREAAGGAALGKNLINPSETEQPPPYSPPKKQAVVPPRFRAVFPTEHPLHAQFPPSPFPASPGLGATMTSQGMMVSPMQETTLPTRPPRAFVCQSYAEVTAARAHKVERQRRRHEKEDVVARRVGGLWRGRGCMPATGCFGRGGREGRKRRRTWLAVWAGVTSLVILVAVLIVVLTRRHHDAPGQEASAWVNLTGFPPMPTGAWSVVGLDNSVSRSACTEPSTLWSCSLPKEEHDAVAPFKANQPTVAMQIQWQRDTVSSHDVKSEPQAPDVKEMWFLGNTTDNVQSEHKAGEATPFHISLSTSAASPTTRETGPRMGNDSLEHLLPPPDLEADGTAAAAVMIPRAVLQPVRLYDRGLASEHYGFYIHFKRSIFLKSVTILNGTEGGNIPLDEDGGCRKNEADYLVTWGETRVLVQMWTRALDLGISSLLRPDSEGKRPGSMPYPVTLTLDTHGGDPKKKVTWSWPVDKRQRVMANKPQLLANRMGAGGSWINPRGQGDPRLGGFDGGSGGCKCEWVNWVRRTSS